MRSIWRTLGRDTASGIGAVLLAVWVIGLSYGATAISSGFPLWLPVVLSFAVLAGGAEFLFLGIIAGGGSPIAAVLAGLVVNARHLPYGLSVPEDVVGTGWRRALGVHVMNDESVALALAESESTRKRIVYWVCGLGVLLAWPGGAVMGALIGSVVPDTTALGLDAVFPAVLLALVVPALRDRTTLGAVCVGVAVAMATAPFLPAGMPVLVALSGVLWAAFRTRGEKSPLAPSATAAPGTPAAPAADSDTSAPNAAAGSGTTDGNPADDGSVSEVVAPKQLSGVAS
ncbi:AzlC family ABC transporter permease [Nocardia sp. NPDC048505]|uniref:AzlC family ABC transporter permease n=1 Tax=unclassified Nocardia TaxID=2637762 RepID=UPI0033EB2607